MLASASVEIGSARGPWPPPGGCSFGDETFREGKSNAYSSRLDAQEASLSSRSESWPESTLNALLLAGASLSTGSGSSPGAGSLIYCRPSSRQRLSRPGLQAGTRSLSVCLFGHLSAVFCALAPSCRSLAFANGCSGYLLLFHDAVWW